MDYQFTDPCKPDCKLLASWQRHFERKGIPYAVKEVERKYIGGFDGKVAIFLDYEPITSDEMKRFRKTGGGRGRVWHDS